MGVHVEPRIKYTLFSNRPVSAIRNQGRLVFGSNVPHEWLVRGTELHAERGINCWRELVYGGLKRGPVIELGEFSRDVCSLSV